jgi:two-component system, NarL family, sensor kinase
MSNANVHPMENHAGSHYNEEMLRVQLEIQDDLFRTLSLHIHDNVGQQLSLSKLYLKSMEKCVQEETRDQVDNVRQLITDCITDLRELAGIFSMETIHNTGLIDLLRSQVSMIRKTGHLQVEMNIPDKLPEPSKDVSLVLFRMIQQSLFDVLCNARATQMEIRLYTTQQYWCAEIRDNRKKETTRFGGVPKGLEKKAKLISAHLYSQYEAGRGVCFKIRLPLNDKTHD